MKKINKIGLFFYYVIGFLIISVSVVHYQYVFNKYEVSQYGFIISWAMGIIFDVSQFIFMVYFPVIKSKTVKQILFLLMICFVFFFHFEYYQAITVLPIRLIFSGSWPFMILLFGFIGVHLKQENEIEKAKTEKEKSKNDAFDLDKEYKKAKNKNYGNTDINLFKNLKTPTVKVFDVNSYDTKKTTKQNENQKKQDDNENLLRYELSETGTGDFDPGETKTIDQKQKQKINYDNLFDPKNGYYRCPGCNELFKNKKALNGHGAQRCIEKKNEKMKVLDNIE